MKIKTGLQLLSLGIALLIATPAIAQQGWTGYSTVKNLVVTVNGGINVRLQPELTGCVSQSGYGSAYASIYPDHPGIDRIHAQLMTAFVTGRKVRLYFVDDQCKTLEMILHDD